MAGEMPRQAGGWMGRRIGVAVIAGMLPLAVAAWSVMPGDFAGARHSASVVGPAVHPVSARLTAALGTHGRDAGSTQS